MAPPAPRIGLVLGAGGVVGASYLAGAIMAIRDVTGWEPALAERVVGTSAGAFIAAIDASGVPPPLTYARCTGEPIEEGEFPPELLELSARMDRNNEGHWLHRYRPPLRVPRPMLASPRLAMRALRAPFGWGPLAALATGLMGEGLLSTAPSIGAVIRTALPQGWPQAPLWVVTLDLDRGERAVLGAPGHPRPDLHVAISAATSIPGVFAPVLIDGRRHCDAGLYSPSNLDVFAGLGLDAVLCINPMSGGSQQVVHEALWRRASERVRRYWRARFDERLELERRTVEASGTRVFVLHPVADDMSEFPLHSMDLGARPRVMRRARVTTAARLRSEPDLAPLADLLRRHAELRCGERAAQAQESL